MRIVNVTDGTDEKREVDCVYITFDTLGVRRRVRISGTSCAALASMPLAAAINLVVQSCDDTLAEVHNERHPLIGIEVTLPSESAEDARIKAAAASHGHTP